MGVEHWATFPPWEVLDLVGSATGTIIAFVLPAMFSFKLKGYTNTAPYIYGWGTVGVVGVFHRVTSRWIGVHVF